MARYAWTREDLVGADLVWILDVEIAGITVHVAQRPITAGDVAYTGGLGDVTVSTSFSLFSDSAEGASASLEVDLPVDLPALIAAGHTLGGLRGELSQLRAGDEWEDRCVMLTGRLVDPSMGRRGEPIRFTLREDVYEDTARIPDAGAVVDDGTFYSEQYGGQQSALLAGEDVGQPYPIILGYPGIAPENQAGWVTGSQGVWANKATNRHALILAGHPVSATEVWVNTDEYPAGQRFEVAQAVDAAGRIVSVVSDSDTASGEQPPFGVHTGLEEPAPFPTPAEFQPAVADSAAFYVGWPDGGGLIGMDGQVVRGAGSVLRWALQQTSLRVDFGSIEGARPYLDTFLIDTAIEDFTSPMEWVQAHILPLLPVSVAHGPRGLYLLVWRPDAEAVGHLDADADPRIETGRLEWDTERVLNRFTLRYGLSLRTNVYQSTARLDATYTANQGYARSRVYRREDPGSYIELKAVERGAAGAITWTLASTGVTDSTDGVGSIALEHNTGVTTLNALAAIINTNSSLVVATVSGTGTDTVGGSSYASAGTLVYADRSTLADYYCALSQARLRDDDDTGVRDETTETEVIYDRETAYRVLAWRAAAFAFPHLLLTALVPEAEWGWLGLGDNLLVSDERLGLSRVRMFVQAIDRQSDGLMGLRLRGIEDPIRDPRS